MNQQESWKLYNQSIDEFNYQYYGDLLDVEHLSQYGQVHFTKFFIPGEVGEDGKPVALDIDFYGYHLIKKGVNYLIESHDASGKEIDIVTLLPIEARNCMKVADSKGNKGEVYYIVKKPVPKRIAGEQAFSPKEFINNLCLLEHSNPKAQKLMYMMALSQLWDKSYYRVASVPSAGKDSTVDICSNLFGNCSTIESPTVAKLEDRASVLKWLTVNEVVDIPKADYDIIQQFLLTAGARKNKITKHSRAFKNVQEVIDIKNFSLSLFYNDVDCYPDPKNVFKPYFDDVTKKPVRDRFPAFRFWGGFTEKFNSISRINVQKFVTENFDWYVNMIKTFHFYKSNFHEYLHGWNEDKLIELTGRDETNIGVLLKIVDFYCDTQEEFDGWVVFINKSMIEYVEMLEYPKHYKRLINMFNKEEQQYEGNALKQKQKEHRDIMKELDKINSFRDKILYLEDVTKGVKGIGNKKNEDDKVDLTSALEFGEVL